MPSGYLVDSLQPDKEVSRVWLCCGKEWGLQQDELHSLWDLLLLAVWSEDWRVRGVMERSDGSGGRMAGMRLFSWCCNPLGMPILTVALSVVCSEMRTTSHHRQRGTSPRNMILMTLVYLKCSCTRNAHSAKL